jgi:triacylglycerol lipase
MTTLILEMMGMAPNNQIIKCSQLSLGERALVAAKLAQLAYAQAEQAEIAGKELGFASVKLLANDGAECLVLRSREDLWLAFRGTEPTKFNDIMADLKVVKHSAQAGGRVHGGFQEEINDLWVLILKELEQNDQLKARKNVYICGHSLGGAMATIAASRYTPTELFTFGSPRVGGKRFIKNVDCTHYRFVNNNDIVTKVPPAVLRFKHHGTLQYFNAYGQLRKLTPWQQVKDIFRGIWAGWKRGKFFDALTDHSMVNYVEYIKNNKEDIV